jgi:hypothetical protein
VTANKPKIKSKYTGKCSQLLEIGFLGSEATLTNKTLGVHHERLYHTCMVLLEEVRLLRGGKIWSFGNKDLKYSIPWCPP